jgi:glycine hydroxymethyltransferase
MTSPELARFDPELAAALDAERARQESYIELIASENYASPHVLEAQGSCLTNKYADGVPGARTYRGCRHIDVVESLARSRARALFGADYANVQPYSGTQANAAVYAALMQPGDTVLGMAASEGGHITHGSTRSFAGTFYHSVQYGVAADTGLIDYDAMGALARRHRPKVIVAGYSAYPRTLDWQRIRGIADEVGAYFVADMAHAAGLIAAGVAPSPVAIADVCTSTTHKTLRGPRGGLILARRNAPLEQRLDAGVYPATQGGPLMHVIAAKAVALKEATTPEFVEYQHRVLENARVLGVELARRGYEIVTGGTDNHMLLVDLCRHASGARAAETALEHAGIAVSAMRLPHRRGAGPNGLRIGTAAVTTRGFGGEEVRLVAALIDDVLAGTPEQRDAVPARVAALCRKFPVYP